jgi:hypothetical protein
LGSHVRLAREPSGFLLGLICAAPLGIRIANRHPLRNVRRISTEQPFRL